MTNFELATAADVRLMQGLAQRVTAIRPELVNSDASFGELAASHERVPVAILGRPAPVVTHRRRPVDLGGRDALDVAWLHREPGLPPARPVPFQS